MIENKTEVPETEEYTQPRGGCPMCGALESTWFERHGDLHWVRCNTCQVEYVLEEDNA